MIHDGRPIRLLNPHGPRLTPTASSADTSGATWRIGVVARRGWRRHLRVSGTEATSAGRLVNLTGRRIVLCTPDGEALLALAPSGYVVRARPELSQADATVIEGVRVPLYSERVSLEPRLPEPRIGVRYVVDRDVALACADRRDLVFPNGGVLDEAADTLRVASLASTRLS